MIDGVAAHFRFMSKPASSDGHLTRKRMHTAIKRHFVSLYIYNDYKMKKRETDK